MIKKILNVLMDIDDIPTPWLSWGLLISLAISVIAILSHK